MQTHCGVAVNVKPTWAKGKSSSYCSKRPVRNINPASTTPASSSQDNDEVIVAEVTPFPAKCHRVILREKSSDYENACRVCHLTHNDTFWIGCGHQNELNGKQDCNYWVCQCCINLYFKSEEKLNAVPFFCPQHGQNKKKSSGKKH